MEFYINLQQVYRWSIGQIDESDLELMIDEIVFLNSKPAKEKRLSYIDEFM